jgi:glycosyltransferase involved in cell wall biosynthesis
MTSDFEGSPNIVREALACEVPVVSVDVGDVQRWLGGPGTRIVARDAARIGAAIADLLRSGERPSPGGLKEKFSDVASRDAVLDVYRQVLAEPSSSAATVTMP